MKRAHANIQKDGTFSVFRACGRRNKFIRIASHRRRRRQFKIPTVKVTGGQRIEGLVFWA